MDSFGPAQGSLSSGLTAAAYPLLAPNGTAAAPSYSLSAEPDTGWYFGVGSAQSAIYSYNGIPAIGIGVPSTTSGLSIYSSWALGWVSGDVTSAMDVILVRDAAAVLALKNGTTAQEFRVYGTTTGTKYAAILHDGTNSYINSVGGGNLTFTVNAANRWNISAGGGLISEANYRFSHGTSALATTATEGYFHLNSAAGALTGVPASIPTGQIPMAFDTTNGRLYVYYGAAWHYIAITA